MHSIARQRLSVVKNFVDMFIHFYTIYERDGQIHTQTDIRRMTAKATL